MTDIGMSAIGFGTATIKGEACVAAVLASLDAGVRLIDTALLYDNQLAVGEALRQTNIPRADIWLTSKVAFFPSDNVASDPWMNAELPNKKGGEASSIDLCLEQLGVESVNLMLIHSPCTTAVEYNAARMPHYFEIFGRAGSALAVQPAQLTDGDSIRTLLMSAKRAKVEAAIEADPTFIARAKAERAAAWAALEAAQRAGKCTHIGVSNYTAELLLGFYVFFSFYNMTEYLTNLMILLN